MNLCSPSYALRSELSPSPQGLTNDDEVGVQSADGVSDSHACSGNESSLLASYHIYSGAESGKAGEVSRTRPITYRPTGKQV